MINFNFIIAIFFAFLNSHSNNNLMGIMVSKTNNDPSNLDKNDHEVDAISGATITGDGVSDMIKERIQHYVPFFNSLNPKQIALN